MGGKKSRQRRLLNDVPEVVSIQPFLFLPKAGGSIPSNFFDDTDHKVFCVVKREVLKI